MRRGQYPKVPRVDYGNGVKITAKPINNDRPVDIWPASITVRDTFKPGGLRIFEGKRQTNKVASPSLLVYLHTKGPSYTHICTHTHMHTHTHTHPRTHTYTHSLRTHTHIHTYTHTRTYTHTVFVLVRVRLRKWQKEALLTRHGM